jgi:hypothetical protein
MDWGGSGHGLFDDIKVPEITEKNNERFSAA